MRETGGALAKQRQCFAVFEHLALFIDQAKAANGVKVQLPLENLARLVLISTADNRVEPERGGTLLRARSEVAGLPIAAATV